MTDRRLKTEKAVLTALFLALGLVLPFLTGQIRVIGKMLCPLHFPVILCGMICGWPYGLAIGITLPLFRSLLFSMPPLYPNAVAMALELATYGVTVGLLTGNSRKRHTLPRLYAALLIAMIAGRLVWGLAQAVLLGLGESGFTLTAFWTGAVAGSLPGIALQLILIPPLMLLLERTGLLPVRRSV